MKNKENRGENQEKYFDVLLFFKTEQRRLDPLGKVKMLYLV